MNISHPFINNQQNFSYSPISNNNNYYKDKGDKGNKKIIKVKNLLLKGLEIGFVIIVKI